jgi:D-lactate dehydrogenase (cytochrome)
VYDQIVEKSSELGGVYSAEHGTGKRKCSDFIKCYGDDGVQSLQKTKSFFDPYFLLNRGNVVDFKQIDLFDN